MQTNRRVDSIQRTGQLSSLGGHVQRAESAVTELFLASIRTNTLSRALSPAPRSNSILRRGSGAEHGASVI
jgi:hypothetical protein